MSACTQGLHRLQTAPAAAAEKHQWAAAFAQPRGQVLTQGGQRHVAQLLRWPRQAVSAHRMFKRFAHIHQQGVRVALQKKGQGVGGHCARFRGDAKRTGHRNTRHWLRHGSRGALQGHTTARSARTSIVNQRVVGQRSDG